MPTQISKVNVESDLLSCEENRRLRQLLGHRRLALAAAVAQLVVTSSPSHTSWQLIHTGVVCFTRDSGRRSHYIQLYGPDSLLWEQELYQNFQFNRVRPFFSTFEADSCQAGLSFADEREASNLSGSIEQYLEKKRCSFRAKQCKDPVTESSSSGAYKKLTSMARRKSKGEKSKKERYNVLSKDDISSPSDFQHLSHVGWNADSGFDVDNVEPSLKEFFSRAGVSSKHLQDDETREFIYDFINQHGGLAGVTDRVARQAPPPPVPPPPPPTPPHRNSASAAPSQIVPGGMTSGRATLMESIRSGTTLHPVNATSASGSQAPMIGAAVAAPAMDGMAGALARALSDRKNVMHSSEDDDSESDQDEWDD